MAHNLSDIVAEEMAKEVAAEIDFEILADILVECGWTKVIRSPFFNNEEAVDIRYWVNEQIKGNVQSRGRTWVFEDAKDATMFILKWL